MCVFCKILSREIRELPWTGNDPVDKYKVLSKWRASHANAYRAFACDIGEINRSSTAGSNKATSLERARRVHGQPSGRMAHGDKTG